MNIREIYLTDMVLKADKGASIAEAQGISLKNIQLVTKADSPVVYIENSSRLRFEGLKFDRGAGLLFSINGKKCSDIRVKGTDLSKAVHDAAFSYGAERSVMELK